MLIELIELNKSNIPTEKVIAFDADFNTKRGYIKSNVNSRGFKCWNESSNKDMPEVAYYMHIPKKEKK